MCDIVPLEDYLRREAQLEDFIQNECVRRNVHEAEMERCERDIDRKHEQWMAERQQWNAERQQLDLQHQRDLREITQSPVYFTRSGRVWHVDMQCPRRFTDQTIFMRGYCTRCAHFLGREAHAPPLLVCVGGYNSNWNRHEPVLQEDDAIGCEDTAEVVCSLTGIQGSSGRWRCALPPMTQKRADVAVA
eukprot:s979_g27.t1